MGSWARASSPSRPHLRYAGSVLTVVRSILSIAQLPTQRPHLQNNHCLTQDHLANVEEDSPQNIVPQVTNMAYKALITDIQVARSRYLLLR
jgi:hypothetical protein